MKTEIHQEARAVIHEILEISLTTPSSLADIFVRWSPHCAALNVAVHPRGWDECKDESFNATGYADGILEPAKTLNGLRDRLREHLETLENPASAAARAARAAKAADLRAQAAKLTADAIKLEGGAA